MKAFFIITFSFIFFNSSLCIAQQYNNTNYAELFKNLPIIDIPYLNNEDPYEYLQYEKHIYSPYPLIKFSLKLKTRQKILKPGFYLLTPRSENGYDFVLFKQNGKIQDIVPVYEKEEVYPRAVYNRKAKPKVPLWKKPFTGLKKGAIKLMGKRKLPHPQPKYAMDSEFVDGEKYFIMKLYFENYAYKMIFKVIH